MAERTGKITWYRAVLDPRGLPFVYHPFDKPIGELVYTPVKPKEIDSNTGLPIEETHVRKPPSEKHKAAMRLPSYEPNDKLMLKVGFCKNLEQPSYIAFRLHINPEECPGSIDQDLIPDGLMVEVKLFANNFPAAALTEEVFEKYYNPEDGNPIYPEAQLPYIVRQTPKFQEMKHLIYKLTVNFDNTNDTMVLRNLFNELVFEHEPTNRAVHILRMIFEQDAVSFGVYLKDEKNTPLLISASDTFKLFRQEIQRVPSKPKTERPQMTTYPPTTYSTVFEMTTRLGVAIIEDMEDKQAKLLDLNSKVAVIRVLEALGAGDAAYFGFLVIKTEIRLMPKDVLRINFRLENYTNEEDWEFTVLEPFKWCVTGEIVGILRRPRQPVAPSATVVEKKAFRPYQKTKVPFTQARIELIEEARACLQGSTPVRCLVTFFSSDRSESRIIQGLNTVVHGSRPNQNRERNAPARVESESIRGWAEFLLMHDARKWSDRNLIPEQISNEYLSRLTDEDHVKVLDYLRHAPVNFNDKCLALIIGIAGSGKSFFAAEIIVARLLGNPDDRILCVASAKQPTDVFIQKVNNALEAARASCPAYNLILEGRVATRIYTDKTELSYIISLAQRQYHETIMALSEDDSDIDENPLLPRPRVNLPLPGHLSSTTARTLPKVVATDASKNEDDKVGNKEVMATAPENLDTVTLSNLHDQQVADEDEGRDDSDDFDESGKGKSKSKNRKSRTKAKRKSEELFNTRQTTLANYVKQDTNRAVTLDDADHEGNDNQLSIFGQLLDGGAVDLDHPSITPDMKECAIAVEMIQSLNRQVQPPFPGVHDKRFIQAEYSIAHNALQYAHAHSEDWGHFLNLFNAYATEGSQMPQEDLNSLKTATKALLNDAKGRANVTALTANALGIVSNRQNLGKIGLVLIDEAGMLDLSLLLLVVASVDFDDLIMLGDDSQLDPAAPKISGPLGCTKELGQSAITYLRSNHWETSSLYLQRRGPPNISVVFSPLFYRDQVKDAPCTLQPDSHPKTAIYQKFFRELFPECTSDFPVRYIDVRGHNEIKDETTGSWMNVDTAALIVSIVEMGILQGVFKAEDVPHITHYTAQQKIFRHAYAELAQEFPGHGFDRIGDYTTDTFQGDGGSCPFADPVRTNDLGFTNNKGRNCVMQTRGEDFMVVVGNPTNLRTNHVRNVPLLKVAFDIARKKRCCVVVSADGAQGKLMSHRYVHVGGIDR